MTRLKMKGLFLMIFLVAAAWAAPQTARNSPTKLVQLPKDITTAEAAKDYLLRQRIAGGQLANRGQFPFMVRLWHSIGDGWWAVCGSSLLNNEWIMTAGHCVDGGEDEYMIILGALNPDDENEEGRVYLTSTNPANQHPGYDSVTIENDIALVKLPQPVEFTDTIQPIALPSRSSAGESFAGREVTAPGWGIDDDDDDTNDPFLKFTQLTVLENPDCQWGLVDSQMCADGDSVRGVCSGDSGSAIFLEEGGQNIVVGVDSFNDGNCPSPLPNGFTRVTSFLDWISETTGIEIP